MTACCKYKVGMHEYSGVWSFLPLIDCYHFLWTNSLQCEDSRCKNATAGPFDDPFHILGSSCMQRKNLNADMRTRESMW